MLKHRYNLEPVQAGEANRYWSDPSIYFVQGAQTRRIKIGFSNFVRNRLDALAFSSPDHLVPLLVMPGCKRIEAFLHSSFAPARLHGEWFKNSKPIRQFIELTHRRGHDFALEVIGWREPQTQERSP